jgi:N6-adenosine-specific RNA methylase IME4
VSVATQLETNHFPTLGLDEICALTIGDLDADDSILFLWRPPAILAEVMRVLEARGFDLWNVGSLDQRPARHG